MHQKQPPAKMATASSATAGSATVQASKAMIFRMERELSAPRGDARHYIHMPTFHRRPRLEPGAAALSLRFALEPWRALRHERRNHRHPQRLRDGPHHPCRRRAHLPDRRLRVRRCPTRRRPVQSGGARQHLHPHHESHPSGAGAARHRTGARRRRLGAFLRQRRGELLPAQLGGGGGQLRHRPAALRRHLHAVRAHVAEARHRGAFRGRGRRGGLGQTHRRQHQGGVLRKHRQPRRQHRRYRGGGGHGPRPRRRHHRGQHRGHAGAPEARRSRL